MSRPPTRAQAAATAKAPGLRPLALAGLLALFAAAGLAVYAPALGGAFLSDDEAYVAANPYIQELSLETVGELLSPTSPHSRLIANYAPVHALLYMGQWQAFGPDPRGYHVVNVLFHALAATLLVVLFLRTGIPRIAALVGGAVFLLHPANVEAVAWIAQLKSPLALVLSLGALLAHTRRPALAWLLFVLALFAKPSALFAFPVAITMTWLDPHRSRRDWAWLGGWAAALVAFSLLSVSIYFDARADLAPMYADPWVRLRTSAAIGLRYLVMAATGYGLSTFHEPPPARSWLDPWWVGSLVALALIAWRALAVARARRTETLYWVWAAAAFAPVSGILSLPFPMADRYLYSILPALIGALLLMLRDAWSAVARRAIGAGIEPARTSRGARAVGLAVAAALCVGYGSLAHARGRVWKSGFHMMADAERHYPEGMAAQTRLATRAARAGRVEEAAAALRKANARGYRRLDQILAEPAYQPYLDDPRFRPALEHIADNVLEVHGGEEDPSQQSLRTMALAHHVRGETQDAIRLLERALAKGGVLDDLVRSDLAGIRRAQRVRAHSSSR